MVFGEVLIFEVGAVEVSGEVSAVVLDTGEVVLHAEVKPWSSCPLETSEIADDVFSGCRLSVGVCAIVVLAL